nr:DNA-directed DNA polymerase [Tanacetum cinerariifolium]
MPRKCLAIIESKSKFHYSRNKPVVSKVCTNTSTFGISPDVAELKDMVKALLLDKKNQNQTPAHVKAVEESCVTCGGAHSYRNCPATDGKVYHDNIQEFVSQASAVNYNQENTSYRPSMMSNQIRPPGFPPVPNNQYVQRNNKNRFIPNQNRGNNFNQGPVYQPPVFQPLAYQAPAYQAPAPQTQGVSKEDFSAYVKANDAVMRNMQTQGTLPSNTIANPRSDLKAITTRSEATKDTVNPTNNEGTEDVQPQVVQSKSTSEPVTSLISKPVIAPVSASKPNLKSSIPYPSRRNDERNHEKANNQIEKFYQIFKDMSFEISFADALILMPKFVSTLMALIENKEKLSMAECLALADLGASINLMPFFVWKRLSLPDLTPTCMTLELANHSISRPVGVPEDVYVKVGSFYFPADFVVVDFDADPRVPLILGRSFLKTRRALIGVFKEVDAFLAIKDDPTSPELYQPYLDLKGDILLLEAFLNDDPSLPPPNQGNYLPEVHMELKICEAKSDKSSVDEPLEVELKDLPPTSNMHSWKSHKRAITWKLSDIKGIDPEFCTHKILMEEDFEPAVQHQRIVNPKIHDVIKQEVTKLLNAGLIYPIYDSPWVSLVHSVPKKGGFTVVKNEDNELIPTRLVTGWRVCIDYRKLNEATRNDHFPLPFMDQMLKINEKSILLHVQRCMMAIFHDMIEKTIEVFMDDFFVFGNSFQSCLSHLERMPKRFEDTNLCLNWEKSHFMVKEGIVLGHKISKQGIKVDKAKKFTFKVIDTKGAENLAADHLSQLENPHQNVLDPKEINESFPLETLNMVSTRGNQSTLWFVDIANYHAKNFVVKGMSSQQKSKFFKDARKPLKFSRLATIDPQEVTMAQITQPRRGTHFYNDQFAKVMQKFGVTHCLATPYHPQTSGQVEVSNRGLKCILKRAVGENCASWSDKLNDALWAFWTAYKTPIGCTPYKLVYGKACHLHIELEHKAYWALKHANFDLKTTGDYRKV